MWEDGEKEQSTKKRGTDTALESNSREAMSDENANDLPKERNEEMKMDCGAGSKKESSEKADENAQQGNLNFIRLTFDNKVVHIDRFGNIITSVYLSLLFNISAINMSSHSLKRIHR